MDPDRWQRVERVLDRALASDPGMWPTLLDDTCSGDPVLRREAEALLARLPRASQFLASPPSAAAAALIADESGEHAGASFEGRRIGPYRIVRQVGRGGMSRVYLAERVDGEFEQRVAFKLLRPGLDSDRDIERFRAERRILASLEHPNIARLFDGGITDDGRPYLILEYVDGRPLDRYCAEHNANGAERLRIFLEIANAVQYAHRHLVVHRDLKPSNVLVTADGTVKLLDFGLAKLLEHTLDSGESPLTQTGRRWMTPGYAAPEQLRGGPVTTLTDVYQLGGVLYELVVGRLPFAERTRSLHELEKAILVSEPNAPSMSNAALRGDIDAIVLKALRKEPDQRYETVQAFAEDVRRHLSGRPVLARPQRVGYRVRRFVARNRLVVAGAVAIALLFVAYVTTVIVQSGRVERALAEARQGTRKAEQVTDFMMGLFQASESGKALTDTVTARALLSRGLAEARQLSGQPALQAQMLDVVGRLYFELGDYPRARPLVDEALATRRRLYGERHPEVAASLEHVADVSEGQQDVARTIQLRRDALTLRRDVSGENDSRTIENMLDLAFALHQSGDVAAATPLFDEWLAIVARQSDDSTASRAAQLTSVADLFSVRGDISRATSTYRSALAMRRRAVGPNHYLVASSLVDLAYVLDPATDGHEADSLTNAAVTLLRASYPGGHPLLASALRTRGIVLDRLGRFADAREPLREALEMRRRLLGHGAMDVARSALDLAYALTMHSEYAEAAELSRSAEQSYRTTFGENSAMVFVARQHLGDALRGQGRYEEADELLLAALARFTPPRPITRRWRDATLDALVRLAEARLMPDDAARYRAMRTSRPPG